MAAQQQRPGKHAAENQQQVHVVQQRSPENQGEDEQVLPAYARDCGRAMRFHDRSEPTNRATRFRSPMPAPGRLQESLDERFNRLALAAVKIALGDQAVGEHRHGQALDVVGHDIAAARDQGRRLSRAVQSQSPAGTCADVQFFAFPRCRDNIQQVTVQRVIDLARARTAA